MGTVRTLPTPTAGVRLADAAEVFLGTIPVANTRRGYAVVLDRTQHPFPQRRIRSHRTPTAARPTGR